MQQFRLVLLDDYDNVIDVEYESKVFFLATMNLIMILGKQSMIA